MAFQKDKTEKDTPRYIVTKGGVTVTIELERNFSETGAFASDTEEKEIINARLSSLFSDLPRRLETENHKTPAAPEEKKPSTWFIHGYGPNA